MPTQAELEIVLKAKNQAEAVLRNMQGTVNQVGKQLQSMGGVGRDAGDTIASASNTAARQVRSVGDAANSSRGFLSNMLSTAAGFGVAQVGIGLAGGAFNLLKDSIVGLNSPLENVEAQLFAFTKDGGKAKEILAQIRAEADQTPFAFQEMAKATAGLMSSAKQAAVPLMDLVRDAEVLAASNPEQGLQGAAFALREAVSGDFTSVIERFNLPRSYINKLKDEGVPALEIVRRTMKEVGYDMDLVSNLSKTASGRWSTFMDTIDGVRSKLTQPLFEKVKEGLEWMQGIFDENKETIAEWTNILGSKLGQAVTDAANGIGQFVEAAKPLVADVLPMLGQAAKFVSDNWDTFKGVLIAVGVVLAGAALVAGIAAVGGLIASLASPIGLVVLAVALLGAAWAGNWGDIQGKTAAVIAFLEPLVSAFLSKLSAWWDAHGASVMAILTWLFDDIVRGFGVMLAGVEAILEVLGKVWKANAGWITKVWEATWDSITWLLQIALELIGNSVDAFAALFRGDWKRLGAELRDSWRLVWQAIVGVIEEFAPLIREAVQAIIEAIWDRITSTDWPALGGKIIEGLVEGLKRNWNNFLSMIRNLVSAAWDTVQGFFGIGGSSPGSSGAPESRGPVMGLFTSPVLTPALIGPTGHSSTQYIRNQSDTVIIQDRASAALFLERQRDQRLRNLAKGF